MTERGLKSAFTLVNAPIAMPSGSATAAATANPPATRPRLVRIERGSARWYQSDGKEGAPLLGARTGRGDPPERDQDSERDGPEEERRRAGDRAADAEEPEEGLG